LIHIEPTISHARDGTAVLTCLERTRTAARAQPSWFWGHQKTVATKKQRNRGLAAKNPTIDELVISRERMHQVSAQFLKIDLETGLTFLRSARQTSDMERQQRNRQAARKAYDTVTKLMDKVRLSDEDARTLMVGLERLRSELEEFGEAF